jgi:hypothetical protein
MKAGDEDQKERFELTNEMKDTMTTPQSDGSKCTVNTSHGNQLQRKRQDTVNLTATQHMVLKETKATKADHPVWRHELWDFDELFEGGEDWWLDISDDEESVGGISYAQEIKDCNNQEVLRVRETFQQWMTAGKPDTAESNTGFPNYLDLLILPEAKIRVTERDLGILIQEARMDKDEDLAEYISKHRAQTRRYHRVHLLITTEVYRVHRMED